MIGGRVDKGGRSVGTGTAKKRESCEGKNVLAEWLEVRGAFESLKITKFESWNFIGRYNDLSKGAEKWKIGDA